MIIYRCPTPSHSFVSMCIISGQNYHQCCIILQCLTLCTVISSPNTHSPHLPLRKKKEDRYLPLEKRAVEKRIRGCHGKFKSFSFSLRCQFTSHPSCSLLHCMRLATMQGPQAHPHQSIPLSNSTLIVVFITIYLCVVIKLFSLYNVYMQKRGWERIVYAVFNVSLSPSNPSISTSSNLSLISDFSSFLVLGWA